MNKKQIKVLFQLLVSVVYVLLMILTILAGMFAASYTYIIYAPYFKVFTAILLLIELISFKKQMRRLS